jgi:diguanylate cyclase (GGDEF)-like protein
MRRTVFTLRRVLATIVCCFVLATGYTAYVIAERQQALQQVTRYNEAWTVSQTLSEFMRLEHRLAASGVDGSGVTMEEVQLRLDIMFGRLDILEQGTLRDFVASDPGHWEVIQQLKQVLENLDQAISSGRAIDMPRMLASLSALDGPMTALASAASSFGSKRIDADQKELQRLHWLFTSVAAGLIICGLSLIFMLFRQNGMLNVAHRKMQVLADDLKATTKQLQTQNMRLAHVAHHDALTGLPNRVVFREQLELRSEALHDRGQPYTVLLLDLDGFKEVNDTLGHDTGDKLLAAAADRLRLSIQPEDIACRLGGDEFAVLSSGLNEQQAIDLGRHLIETISSPYAVGGAEISIGTSIGVALAEEGFAAEEFLKHADLALYEAKAQGRGGVSLFRSELRSKLLAKRSFETDLRQALHNGELQVHYQPQAASATRNTVGYEALLRWQHPERGSVSPCEFIPVAEETGLIHEIGHWVLRTACIEAATWQNPLRIAVNLSSVQFRNKNLLATVVDALAYSGLEPFRLELEITESVLLDAGVETSQTLNRLRALGVSIAMDDFGTGYSSLGNLQKFPFDKIKIDRSFIRDVTTDPQALSIVKAVMGVASGLGLVTTAEGIETEEQLECLQGLGCHEFQGYLIGKPIAAPALGISRKIDKRVNGPADLILAETPATNHPGEYASEVRALSA